MVGSRNLKSAGARPARGPGRPRSRQGTIWAAAAGWPSQRVCAAFRGWCVTRAPILETEAGHPGRGGRRSLPTVERGHGCSWGTAVIVRANSSSPTASLTCSTDVSPNTAHRSQGCQVDGGPWQAPTSTPASNLPVDWEGGHRVPRGPRRHGPGRPDPHTHTAHPCGADCRGSPTHAEVADAFPRRTPATSACPASAWPSLAGLRRDRPRPHCAHLRSSATADARGHPYE